MMDASNLGYALIIYHHLKLRETDVEVSKKKFFCLNVFIMMY